jgi:hypothetical protein
MKMFHFAAFRKDTSIEVYLHVAPELRLPGSLVHEDAVGLAVVGRGAVVGLAVVG